jgi:CDP-diacylglycerol--glycerol-3-phosphate 3-phosphatidyltransferase
LASIYDLKPRFQALLRPLSDALVRAKLSANDVTLGALLLSAAHGAWLALMPGSAWPLLLLPVTLFVRMAMNAIDGMMAKEHGQASAAGAVLNALSDVIADAALYLPFALIPGVNAPLVVLVVVAGVIGEMAGALGPLVKAPRSYAGPFGKSDRALAFGLLAILLGLGLPPGLWTTLYLAALLLLSALTIINRARRIVAEADTLAMMSLMPLRLLPKLRPVAAMDYFYSSRLRGWFADQIVGIIPVKRGSGKEGGNPLLLAEQALDRGEILVIFPEGTRGEPETLQALKKGIGPSGESAVQGAGGARVHARARQGAAARLRPARAVQRHRQRRRTALRQGVL